jgi:hypothetical protein
MTNVNANKATAINELHVFINKLIPALTAYVENNSVRFKNDGTFFEKNRREVREIVDAIKPVKVRCHVSHSEHIGYYVEADTNYKVSEFGCSYAHKWQSFNHFEPLKTDYTEADFINAEKRIDDINKQLRDLEHEKSQIKLAHYMER